MPSCPVVSVPEPIELFLRSPNRQGCSCRWAFVCTVPLPTMPFASPSGSCSSTQCLLTLQILLEGDLREVILGAQQSPGSLFLHLFSSDSVSVSRYPPMGVIVWFLSASLARLTRSSVRISSPWYSQHKPRAYLAGGSYTRTILLRFEC